jgi:dTDP-4-amino-4,6-dideoxygalactose transaminase
MSRVIGGVFALAPDGPDLGTPAWLAPSRLRFANARGGFRWLLRRLGASRAWLPAFLCESMRDAATGAGCDVRLYALDERLRAGDDAWVAALRPGDVVVVVDYFGHVLHAELARRCRSLGAVVVEDASHALLSAAAGTLGDYVLWSPRKFAGLPDGGVLQSNLEPFGEVALPPADPAWWSVALDAGVRRARFEAGGPRDFLPVHQQAEHDHPAEPVAMSDFAQARARTLDWAGIAARRRANHAVLAGALAEFDLMPAADAGTVPVGLTVRVPDRDRVRAALFAHDIFPSLLWPSAWIPAEFTASHALSAQVMTLHCDQRYDETDMIRTATIVLDSVRA